MYSGTPLVMATFILAFLFDLAQIPNAVAWLDTWRPSGPALVLIYWCMYCPRYIGVLTGFGTGLLLDVARGELMGQYALAMSVIAYLTLKVHLRVRAFPLWQQSLSVLGLMIIHQLLVFWVHGILGYPPTDPWYLAPAIGAMLLWPWLVMALTDLRHKLKLD